MRRTLTLLIAALVSLTARSAEPAHTKARLLLGVETARPGETITVGLHLRMDPAWHTYWKNAGESGIPTTLEWTLPPGITAGEIQWPVPEKVPPDDLVTYAYFNEVVLLVPLTIAPDAKPGPYELKAAVEWLECLKSCYRQGTTVSATLNVGSETKASADAGLIKTWQQKLPKSSDGLSPAATWEKPLESGLRPVVIEWTAKTPGSQGEFLPDSNPQFTIGGKTETLPAPPGKIRIRKEVHKFAGSDWPKAFSGLLVETNASGHAGYEATLPVHGTAALSAASPNAEKSLWRILLYAFLGGIILNVMPCVLPVISLKILGFINEAASEPRRVRNLGFIYALGVLLSFLTLALIVIALQAAGHKVGWGLQFSNPYFVVGMTVLVTLIALNLFGVFEIAPGARSMTAAAALSSRHGATGAFFNGLLTTFLATSCSAPILGYAIGYAFSKPPLVLTGVLLMVGVGMVAPYVILSWRPSLLKFLPKPGAWMERFKVAMGFPMLGAAIWLLSLVWIFYGERTWWLAVFLVFLAIAAWVYGAFVQHGTKRRWLGTAIAAVFLVTGYVYAMENKFQLRKPETTQGPQSAKALDLAPKGYNWEPWSPEAVARAQAEGRPAIVDFTAKWCPNCQLLVKPALASESVRTRLKELNAVALLADYTRFPDDITEELTRRGQPAVPLVLVFSKEPGSDPVVLPEAFTPGIILNALDQATGPVALK